MNMSPLVIINDYHYQLCPSTWY